MKTLILNKGITKTAFMKSDGINHKIIQNKIAWDADYDGKEANLSIDIDDNGQQKHIDIGLTNEDLSKLLSIPSERTPLDQRLVADFYPEEHGNQLLLPFFLKKSKHVKSKKSKKTKSSKSGRTKTIRTKSARTKSKTMKSM
jgi:hypothetical protein